MVYLINLKPKNMENINSGSSNFKLSFHGKGGEYFGIVIVNWLLTIITLGIYYPWAKAAQLKYLYGATALNNDRFAFHGTGKEMFKGFIKAILIFIVIFGVLFLFIRLNMPIVGFILFYLCFIAIVPLAIHGSYRYRMSRTSWRGIRFGYRGDKKELIINFFKWFLLTIVTIGIYGAWMAINLRKYVLGKVRFGDMEFKYDGDGGEFFIINLKGYLLSIITLGIYMFWWQSELFAYYIDNLTVNKGEKKITMKSTATGGDFFGLLIVNMLILIFTLGIGYAWVVTRTMNFIANKIELSGDINLDEIKQSEESYADATGEDLTDMLDIDFIF